MSREIKFRAFDTSRKKMYTAEELGQDQMSIDPGGGGFYNPDPVSTSRTQWYKHLVPMQFTGLKDKNGKEIYEGDILKSLPYMRLDDTVIISKVIFEEQRGMWVADAVKYGEKEYLHEAVKPAHETEIIGNVHENADLLNQ